MAARLSWIDCQYQGFSRHECLQRHQGGCSFACRTWTNDLRGRGIRVNVLSPGHIDTPILESLQQGEALTKLKNEMRNNVPLGRLGDPDEIAKAVSFLASDEASYISGIELFVDGGIAQIDLALRNGKYGAV